jgi:tetratricopeptide (TPR) repeat protein
MGKLRFLVEAMFTCAKLLTGSLALWLIALAAPPGARSEDWPDRIRALAAAGKLADAMQVVEQWKAAEPGDFEARTWHARVEAWQGHMREAEQEFRLLLEDEPGEPDLLVGLAGVLNAQKQYAKALEALERACPQPAARPECGLARARTLALLGRGAAAREIYRALSQIDAVSAQSKRELDHLREAGRYRVRLGASADLSSFSGDGSAFSAAFSSRWNARWETEIELAQQRRFGKTASGGQARVTWRLGPHDALTLGGGSAGMQDIAPRAVASLGYDHGFAISRHGAVRAVEAIYDQRWTWYSGTRILSLSPAALVYLPRDWDWLLQTTATGLRSGAGAQSWKISAQTRLAFPLRGRFRASLMAATGAENFGSVEQLLFRSSTSAGAGLGVRLGPGRELRVAGRYQRIAGGRYLMSYEGGYALRF